MRQEDVTSRRRDENLRQPWTVAAFKLMGKIAQRVRDSEGVSIVNKLPLEECPQGSSLNIDSSYPLQSLQGSLSQTFFVCGPPFDFENYLISNCLFFTTGLQFSVRLNS